MTYALCDLIPIRVPRNDVKRLVNLSAGQRNDARKRPYIYLTTNAEILDIFTVFWEWAMLTSRSPIVEVFGSKVNQRFISLIPRFEQRTEAIRLWNFPLLSREDHCVAIYENDDIVKAVSQIGIQVSFVLNQYQSIGIS